MKRNSAYVHNFYRFSITNMKKYIQHYILCLIVVCGTSCNKPHKTTLTNDTIQVESNDTIASYGPSRITRTIKEDRNGNIWLASWDGIFKYNGNSFTNITSDVSLSRFFSILEDRKGNFWFASIGSGVFYYDGNSFQNFTIKDGLASNRVTHIYEDKKGNIWFGTEGGISFYNGKIFRNFTTKDGLPHNDVNVIIEDKTGKFWIATRGFACFYDGKTFTKVTGADGLFFENVRAIIEDNKGHIWLGGKDGLWRYDGSLYTNYAKEFVGYIYEDKKGTIWTSSQSSHAQGWTLSFYESGPLSPVKANATEALTEAGMFFGILEDFNGHIWLGTLNGVYRYDGKTFKDFKDPTLKDKQEQ